MSKNKHVQPRLITFLTILLLLQAPVILLLGLNLLTQHWSFLTSWSILQSDIQTAFSLVVRTPGQITANGAMFYDVFAFVILVIAAVTSLIAGILFSGGKAFTWILSLIVQIGTLISGIGLFVIHRPPQAYWLMLIGIIMVLYLNYEDVRDWFLQSQTSAEEQTYG
jgi:hypothetical protein